MLAVVLSILWIREHASFQQQCNTLMLWWIFICSSHLHLWNSLIRASLWLPGVNIKLFKQLVNTFLLKYAAVQLWLYFKLCHLLPQYSCLLASLFTSLLSYLFGLRKCWWHGKYSSYSKYAQFAGLLLCWLKMLLNLTNQPSVTVFLSVLWHTVELITVLAWSSAVAVYGCRDLFWLPVEQYRRDGRIVRGFQRGAQSFMTCTAMSTLELTNRVVQTIQVTVTGTVTPLCDEQLEPVH